MRDRAAGYGLYRVYTSDDPGFSRSSYINVCLCSIPDKVAYRLKDHFYYLDLAPGQIARYPLGKKHTDNKLLFTSLAFKTKKDLVNFLKEAVRVAKLLPDEA